MRAQDANVRVERVVDGDMAGLSTASRLLISRSGGLVVLQPQDYSVRTFDKSGRSGASFGREGEGPGEFRSLGPAGWVGDTLWVADIRQRRTVFLDRSHRLLRTVAWPAGVTSSDSRALSVRGVPPVPWAYDSGGGVIVPLTFARPTNLAETGRALVTIDATGRMQRVVASLPSATNFACASRWSSGGASGAFSIPFCSYPLVQVSDDGRWVVSILQGHGGSSPSGARLVLLSTSGDTLANVPIDLAQVPMPSRVADSAKAALLNPTVPGVQYTLPPAAIKALKEVVIPPTYPIVKSVLLGSDRSVWVEHWMPGGSLRWSLLDERTGRTVRRIALPGGVQVFAGDAGQLVGVRTDASGVEHVERYIIVQ